MKGIIFTFDAVFALVIAGTIIPIFILLAANTVPETTNQRLSLQAEDAMDVISRLRVADVAKEQVISDIYLAGGLSSEDLNRTVLELVSALWASNSTVNETRAQNITQQIFGRIMPQNAKWGFSIDGENLYDTGGTFVSTVTASRRIVSGFRKGQPSAGYVASAFLNSIGGKNANSYFFFGGFVGQGNITAKISGIPVNTNVTRVYLEMNAGENFTLYINGAFCSTMNVTTGNFTVNNWTINSTACINSVIPGAENSFTINFTKGNITNEYVGGGYLSVTYSTEDLLQTDGGFVRYRFPGVGGLVNVYDSFYVPGNITGMDANITFSSAANYTTVLNIGNVTVVNHTGNGSRVTLNISNSTFYQMFAGKSINYMDLSSRTVPLRMLVSANITGGALNGTTDVVLITDVSGSMAWRLDQDFVNGNTINNCNNPNITQPSTSRISLAKCLDKTFVNAILGGNASACGGGAPVAGNRVALVSFSSSANVWESFTSNITLLESRINSYAASGGTCVSCAINRAYDILASQSNASRSKYIVVMTDGVANYRSAPICYDMNDVSHNFSVGETGASALRANAWQAANVGGPADNFNDVSVLNGTLARAAADGGEIYYWNGAAWALEQDTGANDVNGIEIFNRTFGFAVGASAKIWGWDGFVWTETNDFGSFAFRGVTILNRSWAFAVGDSGVIYRWDGSSWALQQDVGTATLYSVDAYSATLALAAGSSGKIYRWDGAAWAEISDTGSNTHNDVAIVSGTKAFTASSNGAVYEWDGAAWTSVDLSPYDLEGVHVVNSTLAYAVGDERGDIYEWNGTAWSRTYSPFYYEGTSTTGLYCFDNDACSLSVSESYPALNANYSAYRAFTNLTNLTVDSVGFGPVSTCTLGNQTVREIAKTGNGTAYSSTNASELQAIYCQIALNIITKATLTQQIAAVGALQPSELSADSFIRFQYASTVPPAEYQEISLGAETERLPGCDGGFFIPPDIKVVDALRTSYSGVFWTKNMFLNSSVAGSFSNIYNLSSYAQKYAGLGDPFHVYVPVSLLAANETNTVRNELGLNASYLNTTCSSYDRIIYTARLRASVPFGQVFPQISGGIVRVYYDIDHDGVGDGYTDITVGGSLPNFNPAPRTVDQLDPVNNALDDALIRLLDSLNLVVTQSGTGRAGESTNPIDVELANINIDVTGVGGVPFAWGPLDITLEVRI